ncbi:MAG TPA: nickel pincer cofactor biosynthesis protein LarB [Gemmatimonadaceae bacterium]|nr:nickel pincer cofactor biosynthesis protein LarB [Gemmatimonadaceae bacterium]
MTHDRVRDLLARVADGRTSPDHALKDLAKEPFESLDFATIDHHRSLRQGFPEVIYGAGKTPGQVVAIAERIAERSGGFLATRLAPEASDALASRFHQVEINAVARTAHLAGVEPPPAGRGVVQIVTAGTSDLPVAEECAVTAGALGNTVARMTDVGVAGIHRLLARKDELFDAAVIIVIAGMDGALASVVGGLVRVPVIAVPTSVGYGAAFGGLAPLLTMLNSCAAGVTVVNIDNGFGAAMAASRINHA